MSTPLILASQSPRRRELLDALGLEFRVHPSRAEEVTESKEGPAWVAEENARIKATDVAGQFPDEWVIGSDTVVALDGMIFGKPESMPAAESMLLKLQGETHRVFSGVCLMHHRRQVCELWHEETQVGFRSLTLSEIKAYLKRINPLDKAGAYAIQEGGERIVSRVEGSLSNVVGLPLESLEAKLAQHGLR